MARKHNVDEVIRSLSSKNDCKVSPFQKVVEVLKNKVHNHEGELVDNPRSKNDLGNGSQGKIDFLKNHCGYSVIYVGSF